MASKQTQGLSNGMWIFVGIAVLVAVVGLIILYTNRNTTTGGTGFSRPKQVEVA
jgi:uncharacterized membrane protein